MKKFLLASSAVMAVIIALPMFAAFEAHVINVTATIENALSVPVTPISFGTVFPQEALAKPLSVTLSESFKGQNRVTDVSYYIRQKPKCAVTSADGVTMDSQFPTATGEVIVDPTGGYHVDCGAAPAGMPTGEVWGVLPSLCQYLSKDIVNAGAPDTVVVPPFHQPFTIVNGAVQWLDAAGHVSLQSPTQNWNIDLKVPCFGGFCAQDWASFVHQYNANADPTLYVQPASNEHKVFGCDLWVEVNGVTTTPS